MATHSSILACRSPQTEEPGRLHSIGRRESDRTEHAHMHPKPTPTSGFLHGKWYFKI